MRVRPRGRNMKSGNLLPLILRDLIFIIFAIAIHKNTAIKGPRKN